jgi:hypothetical protein
VDRLPSFREGGPDHSKKEGPTMAVKDPDEMLVVLFKQLALPNEAASLREGRPIFDDKEVCEVRSPGSKDVRVFHANEFSRWVDDPLTGGQVKQSYAERFSHQYRQFKSHNAQTKTGTPLNFAAFLSEGRRAELRAQNVYTIEQLAAIDGAELKNLGPGGREMKNSAMAYIEEGKASAPNKQMLAELEALKARNAILEEDMQARKANGVDSEFDAMSLDELRAYIAEQTGQEPLGSKNMNRKTLVRMAENSRPDKAA